jgi:hypothetical protein
MRIALYILAGVLLLVGGIWFFQGIGTLPGSFMTGQTRWALYGALAFILGCVIMALTLLKKGRRARK